MAVTKHVICEDRSQFDQAIQTIKDKHPTALMLQVTTAKAAKTMKGWFNNNHFVLWFNVAPSRFLRKKITIIDYKDI